jgi:hypothetical protein
MTRSIQNPTVQNQCIIHLSNFSIRSARHLRKTSLQSRRNGNCLKLNLARRSTQDTDTGQVGFYYSV